MFDRLRSFCPHFLFIALSLFVLLTSQQSFAQLNQYPQDPYGTAGGVLDYMCLGSNSLGVVVLSYNNDNGCPTSIQVPAGVPVNINTYVGSFASGPTYSASVMGGVGTALPITEPPNGTSSCFTLYFPASYQLETSTQTFAPGTTTITSALFPCDIASNPYIWTTLTVVAVVVAPSPTPTATPQAPGALTYIDPTRANPSLLNGNQITTNVNSLASAITASVIGVAADGTAEIVIQIPYPGKDSPTFTLSLLNDQGVLSTDPAGDGALLSGTGGGGTVLTKVGSTSVGQMAFATYLAPSKFVRGSQDIPLTQRQVTLSIQWGPAPNNVSIYPIIIRRPPVVLVHGLWSDASTWNTFQPLKGDARFGIYTADYSTSVPGVTATDPVYPQDMLNLNHSNAVSGNSLGLAYNAPILLKKLRDFITAYAVNNQVASIQADVIAHSLGGIITRTVVQLPGYSSNTTYGSGYIHSFITIGSPHLGSPLGTDLLQSTNTCMRQDILAGIGHNFSFTSVTSHGTQYAGGVFDASGNGNGGGMSQALTALQAQTFPFSVAYLAGITNAKNLAGIGCPLPCPAAYIRFHCKGSGSIPTNFTPENFNNLYGQGNDTIIPLNSEINLSPRGKVFPAGLIHSTAMEGLSFNGPSELDPVSGISQYVIDLLNGLDTNDWN